MSMSDGGKGSTPRPFSVTQEEYSKRWDMIFARDLKNDSEKKKESLPEESTDTESQNSK